MKDELQEGGKGEGVSIAALVLGIVSFIAAFIPCFNVFALIGGLLAIIFGSIGLSLAKKRSASVTLPRTGLILGIVSFLIAIVMLVIYIDMLKNFIRG